MTKDLDVAESEYEHITLESTRGRLIASQIDEQNFAD